MDKTKHVSAIVLSLDGKGQDAGLELPTEDLAKDHGVETLIKRFDTIFRKDAPTNYFFVSRISKISKKLKILA